MSLHVKNEWNKVKYLTDYEWSSNISIQTRQKYDTTLGADRSNNGEKGIGRRKSNGNYQQSKCKNNSNKSNSKGKQKNRKNLTCVRKINDKNHPAFGQHGLFAIKKIMSKSWICDYIGFIENSKHESQTSDYILHFIDDLSIDSENKGNEARFINDYRGIGQRPNAKFSTYWQDGKLRMGVFSMSQPIRANTEILVSYGKGFWNARQKEKDNENENERKEDLNKNQK